MVSSLLRRDAVLRTAGLVLVAAALLCLHLLATGPARSGHAGLAGTMEAAAGILGISFGGVLLGLGRHIHDPMRVSARWTSVRRAGSAADQVTRRVR